MGRAGLWRLSRVGTGRCHERFGNALLGAELPQGTQPVFEMVSPGYLAVSDGLNIDGHDLEALAALGHAKQVASGCSSHLAAYDDTVPGDEDFLDLKPHVGDGLGKASDHLDRCITTPAFTRQITPARLVVRREDLFLQGFHIALDGLVEQAVPWRNGGARLCLGQALSRGGACDGQQTGGEYELSELFHDFPLGWRFNRLACIPVLEARAVGDSDAIPRPGG